MTAAPFQLFAPLPPDEYEALKASIEAKGLLAPIVKDQHGAILDGHHREQACRELGIDPRYEIMPCVDDAERKVRALVMNLLRRHLTREQKAKAVAELRALGYTFERIATETGMSYGTVQGLSTESADIIKSDNGVTGSDDAKPIVTKSGAVRPASYKRKSKPKLTVVQAKNTKEAARAGKALDSLGDAAPTTTMDVKRAERAARERQADARRAEQVEPATVAGGVDIRHGDFRQILADIPDGSVDAIITDPPYPGEFVCLFVDLSQLAARILKPSGVLVAMCGQYYLPEYIASLGDSLRYRWCAAYVAQGARTRVHAARVGTGWKPLLVYQRHDAAEVPFLVDDLFDAASSTTDGVSKRFHHWGQSEPGIAEQVERFTQPGQLVVDPFLGGGTTAVVCRDLGRRFIGCDIDAAHVTTSRERLG